MKCSMMLRHIWGPVKWVLTRSLTLICVSYDRFLRFGIDDDDGIFHEALPRVITADTLFDGGLRLKRHS